MRIAPLIRALAVLTSFAPALYACDSCERKVEPAAATDPARGPAKEDAKARGDAGVVVLPVRGEDAMATMVGDLEAEVDADDAQEPK